MYTSYDKKTVYNVYKNGQNTKGKITINITKVKQSFTKSKMIRLGT